MEDVLFPFGGNACDFRGEAVVHLKRRHDSWLMQAGKARTDVFSLGGICGLLAWTSS